MKTNEVKGIKKVKIDLEKLSPEARAEVERKLRETRGEAKELRKIRNYIPLEGVEKK